MYIVVITTKSIPTIQRLGSAQSYMFWKTKKPVNWILATVNQKWNRLWISRRRKRSTNNTFKSNISIANQWHFREYNLGTKTTWEACVALSEMKFTKFTHIKWERSSRLITNSHSKVPTPSSKSIELLPGWTGNLRRLCPSQTFPSV